MDLTSQVLHDVEFREAKRGGYHTQDVDEFLERLAVAVDRQEAQLREARQRVAAAEGRAAEAERRAEDAGHRAGGSSDADETLRRTLVLAQRTADAAIREAEERSSQMLSQAEDEAQRLIADARDASAQAYADAEAEARRAQQDARSRVIAELQELEAGRELLRGDVELLEAHIDQQRERLRLTIRDLTALVEDPAALREALVPTIADVQIPSAVLPELPQPPRRLVAAPVAPEDDFDEDPQWAGPDDVDDYAPVDSPSPRRAAPERPRPAERPLLADSRSAPPVRDHFAEEHQPDDGYDDDDDLDLDDGPDDDRADEGEDSYLAELRKAMTDDEPLGPRDDDDFGDGPAYGRSRFGRRR